MLLKRRRKKQEGEKKRGKKRRKLTLKNLKKLQNWQIHPRWLSLNCQRTPLLQQR